MLGAREKMARSGHGGIRQTLRAFHSGLRKVIPGRENAYGEAKPPVAYEEAYQVVDSRSIKGMTEGRNALSEEVEPGRFGDCGGTRRDPELAQDVGNVAVDSVLAQDE